MSESEGKHGEFGVPSFLWAAVGAQIAPRLCEPAWAKEHWLS